MYLRDKLTLLFLILLPLSSVSQVNSDLLKEAFASRYPNKSTSIDEVQKSFIINCEIYDRYFKYDKEQYYSAFAISSDHDLLAVYNYDEDETSIYNTGDKSIYSSTTSYEPVYFNERNNILVSKFINIEGGFAYTIFLNPVDAKETHYFYGPGGGVSDDGRYFAGLGYEDKILLYDSISGNEQDLPYDHPYNIDDDMEPFPLGEWFMIRFSTDNQYIFIHFDMYTDIYSIADLKVISKINYANSANSNLILEAISSKFPNKEVTLNEVYENYIISSDIQHWYFSLKRDNYSMDFALSPDHSIMGVFNYEDNQTELMDTESKEVMGSTKYMPSYFNGSGKVLVGKYFNQSEGGFAYTGFVNPDDGAVLHITPGPGGGISDNGLVYCSLSYEDEIIIYNKVNQKETRYKYDHPFNISEDNSSALGSWVPLHFSKDNNHLFIHLDRSIEIYSLEKQLVIEKVEF